MNLLSVTQPLNLISLKAFIDACPVAIGVSRMSDSAYVAVNEAFLVMHGYNHEEVIGHTSEELQLWRNRESRSAVLTQLQRTGSARNFFHEYRHKSGRVGQAIASVDLFDLEGIAHLIGFLADISETSQLSSTLAETESTYQALFQNMLNGMAYCRMLYEDGMASDFIYLKVNKAFEEQTGLKNVRDRKVSEVIPGIRSKDKAIFELYERVVKTGVAERTEVLISALNQWFSISVFKVQTDHFAVVFDVITERKNAQLALANSEYRLQRAMEATNVGLWDWDLRSEVAYLSPKYYELTGYGADEVVPNLDFFKSTIHPDDLASVMQSMSSHLRGESEVSIFDYRLVRKDGQVCWILGNGRVIDRSAEGKPLRMIGTITDISDRKISELALTEASVVFTNSFEGIMVVDSQVKVVRVNPAFTRVTGYAEEEIIGNSPKLLSSGLQGPDFYKAMWESIHTKGNWRGEIWNRRKNGEVYAELLAISVVRDALGAVQYYIGAFSDISQIKSHELELDRVAHYDPLTGTPNRRLLADRMEQAIFRVNRRQSSLAVCYMDLDGFKDINDRFGHGVGDQVLIAVSNSLKHILRTEDTLARLGGDEFVMLLDDIGTPEECVLVLNRILNAIKTPIAIDGNDILISCSIGVSLYPLDHADADALLRHADQAMYQAKAAGRNCFQLFDPESDLKAQAHQQFVERMHCALSAHEFCLYYQPKVDLTNGKVLGVEALIRWDHPQEGILPPAAFLHHVEGSTLDHPLGHWVMCSALEQASQWKRLGHEIQVSINVGAQHLLHPDFLKHLRSTLDLHPELAADCLELEVLESVGISNMDQTIEVLKQCHQIGVKLALDDFGTGYSSLTYLRKLPVDTIKIDQSFVRDMLVDAEDFGIVEGVISLARAFNRKVIAEGVETIEHGHALTRLGCHLAQGYGIAKPMPGSQFLTWLQDWSEQRAWAEI
ncbi:EAL domain-containing protein [Rhodoferax sp. GW822-FHT02A01]|uniref:EAL domain-containing protein n=1 Tax=Rhodoferax sp. GW822-FHT02A01 TaxID=3141537 RepID=UPI00315DFDCF